VMRVLPPPIPAAVKFAKPSAPAVNFERYEVKSDSSQQQLRPGAAWSWKLNAQRRRRNVARKAEESIPDGHRRVLVVDDDSPVRGSLAAVLESEGYVVDEARDGLEAVSRAIEHTPDLVLLDLNMPRWDGWTAFGQLERVSPLLPVIVITARPNQYEKAVRLGVDAFMEKPLNIPILVKAVERLVAEDEAAHMHRVASREFITEYLGAHGQSSLEA